MAKDKKGKGSGSKDACYHKVKSRYSVWPSAYASGALVKCRKVGAANWGNKSESFEVQDGVVEGVMPEPIDPKKHRDASKQSKINNMKRSDNPNERKVAEKKLTPAAKVDTPVTRTNKIREFSKNTEPRKKPEGPKLMGEGKYSKSETYVKGTAPVRATYGGKTESFPKETYKKKTTKTEELNIDLAVDYFFTEGINEDGLEMIIEETGLEKFVEFVEYLTDIEVLTEARAARKARKGAKSYEQVKAEIDAKEKAKSAKREISVDKTKKATETAKVKQPEKKPVRDAIARGVFRAVDAYKKGMERHNAAMATAKKAGKVAGKAAGELAKGAGEGVKTAGKVAKVAYKVASEEVQIDEGALKDRASRAVQNQRDGYHGDDDALTKEMSKTKKSVAKLKNSNVVTRYSADAAAKKLEKSIKKEEVEVSEGDKYDNVGKQAARMSLLNNPGPRSTPEQSAAQKKRLEKKHGMKLDDHPQFKKEEVDKRRAPAELVARLSTKREGHMAQDGPNKAAYDAKQRILKKTKEKMAEQMLSEKPYQITGPHSYTAGDGDPKDDVKIQKTPYNVGKPMKSKVRARNKVDKMNQEYGASVYRMKYVEGIEDSIQKMLDEAGKKCWKGYKKAGTQKLFGKTYNRCVKANEELSIDQQMKISRDYNRMSPEEKKAANKKAMGNVKKVAPKKDTRTDAQKMTDATGPRPGSRYRGD